MPKRTNDFQRFVTHIYEQMTDGIVRESELIKEKNSDSEREVDVLIRKKVCGNELNIAVECRKRDENKKSARKNQSIEWIDCLIGKYMDLPIHEVIAVSKSGFSETAKQKALAHGIKTLTLDEAEEVDWNNRFTNLFGKLVTRNYFPKEVLLKTDIPLNISISLDTAIYSNQQCEGTLNEVAKICFQNNREQIDNKIDLIVKTDGDKVFEKEIIVGLDCQPSQNIFIFDGESKIRIAGIHIDLYCKFDVANIDISKYFFDKQGISKTEINLDNGDKYQVISVQKEGKEPVIKSYPA